MKYNIVFGRKEFMRLLTTSLSFYRHGISHPITIHTFGIDYDAIFVSCRSFCAKDEAIQLECVDVEFFVAFVYLWVVVLAYHCGNKYGTSV